MKTEKELNLLLNNISAIFAQIKRLQHARTNLEKFEYRGLKGLVDIGHRVFVSLGPISIQYPTNIDTLTIRYNECIILEYSQSMSDLFSLNEIELKDIEAIKKILDAAEDKVVNGQRAALDNFRAIVKDIFDDTEEVAK